jgi:hypothetical protein
MGKNKNNKDQSNNKKKKKNNGRRGKQVIARGEKYRAHARSRTRGANSKNPM